MSKPRVQSGSMCSSEANHGLDLHIYKLKISNINDFSASRGYRVGDQVGYKRKRVSKKVWKSLLE